MFQISRIQASVAFKSVACKRKSIYLTPFNFRPPLIFGRGGRKLEGSKKSSSFLGGRKLKGAEIFPKPIYNIKTKTKKFYL